MFRDLETLKQLMGVDDPDLIQKALTVTSGFVGINLEPTAKLMLPLFAGLRNRLPADKPAVGGQQAIWRMQLGYGGFDFAGNMGTVFGAVGPDATGTAVTVQADYRTQAIKGSTQFEAIPMAMGFDDPLAIETSRSLATLLRLEELLVLGGNAAAIAAPATPTQGTVAPGGAAFAVGNWRVQVSAVTLQGAISNAAGNSNVGESAVNAALTIAVAAGGATFLEVQWPVVPGAVGYKIYADTAVAGTIRLVPRTSLAYKDGGAVSNDGSTFVSVNHIRVTAPPAGGQPTPPGADGTVNANVYEGLIPWAQKSTIYGQAVGTKIFKDMDGAKLTTAGSGVTEFDTILQNFWSTWQISPTLIVTGPKSASALTDALVAANSAFMYRVDISQERGRFTGGVYVGGYINKFAASMLGDAGAIVPVWAHPYMPEGNFLFLTERIPYQYSREARGFALDVLSPYTYFELARTDRSFPFSIFFTETLKCYHPLAQGSISGARIE